MAKKKIKRKSKIKSMKKSRKKTDFIKLTPTRKYINDVFKMRSAKKAVKEFINQLDSLSQDILKEAAQLAKQDQRNTIMSQDILPALEKYLGRKHLSWQETAGLLLNHTPAELSKISKLISKEIEKKQKK